MLMGFPVTHTGKKHVFLEDNSRQRHNARRNATEKGLALSPRFEMYGSRLKQEWKSPTSQSGYPNFVFSIGLR